MTIEQFINYLDRLTANASEEELDRLYDENFRIEFHGKATEVPYDAVSFNAITDALKAIKSEE